jgi:hypothetical protein
LYGAWGLTTIGKACELVSEAADGERRSTSGRMVWALHGTRLFLTARLR